MIMLIEDVIFPDSSHFVIVLVKDRITSHGRDFMTVFIEQITAVYLPFGRLDSSYFKVPVLNFALQHPWQSNN
jgi:hypothetical protein